MTMATTEYVFDLDGGRTCLDFANTLSSSGEHLTSYADLVAFALQSELITADEAAWLRAEAAGDPRAGEGVLTRARRLRGAVYAIFAALAQGASPRQADVDTLNAELGRAMAHARVVGAGGEAGYDWGLIGRDIDMPLWGISRSAADLLVDDDDRRLVRQCGGDDCAWLFVDTSKNRTRQWCSMRSCGNRAKARRHYQRTRDSAREPKAG